MPVRRSALLAGVALAVAGAAVPAAAQPTSHPVAHPARAAMFDVGAATVNINPSYPVYLGGYGGGPAGGTLARPVDPITRRRENVQVKAISIASHGHVVEIARVDAQGYFAGYQEGAYGIEDIRRAAAAYLRSRGSTGARAADIVVSALHEHAVPTLLGIWGPTPAATRSTGPIPRRTAPGPPSPPG